MKYCEQLREAKRQIVASALELNGTVSGAARELGLARQSMHRLMQQFSIPSPNPGRRGVLQ